MGIMGKEFTRSFKAEWDSHRGSSQSFQASNVPQISRDDETIRESALNVTRLIMKDSPFFESNPPRMLPMFGHNEITLGKTLGNGKYGNVREVTKLGQLRGASLHKLLISESSQSRLNRGADYNQESKTSIDALSNSSHHHHHHQQQYRQQQERESKSSIKSNNHCRSNNNKNHKNNDATFGSSCDEIDKQRAMLRARCHRDGKARYALKQLRNDLKGEERFLGAIDIATEAKFLASLSHPNIVKLRATVGELGHPNFMLILDRLYCSLDDQLNIWKKENRRCFWKNKFKPLRSLSSSCHGAAATTAAIAVGSHHHDLHHHGFFRERLFAAYDVARALKHLHGHNILYRDLKPENLAYDVRGDVRIFDLGFATELTNEKLIRLPEDYDCTGLTGSRRWMAPEVHLSLPYGPSADVYSFGLLFWNIFSLNTPFGNKISVDDHFQRVIINGERPSPLRFLPSPISQMMTQCWDTDRSKRPSFQQICTILREEIQEIEAELQEETTTPVGDGGFQLHDRTDYLNGKSNGSCSGLHAFYESHESKA